MTAASRITATTRAASVVFGAARIVLGALWLHEGLFKFGAHFGRADILLVADGASAGGRVPEYFSVFAGAVLRNWPGLFGVLTPVMETALGVALILGVFTMPAALASLSTLMLYWSSDQLIAQYPIMGMLSAVVLGWPVFAARWSTTALVAWLSQRRGRRYVLFDGPLRQWL